MSTRKLFLNSPLMARLDDDDLENKEVEADASDDTTEDNVDEEWGADISIGDEEEGGEEEKKKEEEDEDEEDDNE